MKTWIEAEVQSAREVLEEFGQEIAFHPMRRDANRRSVWDTDRESFSFCGVFEWPSSALAQKDTDVEISLRAPIVFARRQDLATMPKNMDRLSLQTQGRLALFEINEVQPDGRSGVMFVLNQIGTHF
jgi:hypothetical protein